jgi:hypothetical protein
MPNEARDRRINTRFPCAAQALCRPLTDDVEDIHWSVNIADISRGGVRLVAVRRFERGTVLHINTEEATTGELTALIAKVIHVSQGEQPGKWKLGCHFAKKITLRELVTFLPKTA